MFEKSTWIRLPRNVVVGHGVRESVVEVLDDLHMQGRPLLVTSPTPRAVAADPIAADLEDRGVDPAIVTVETATFDAVETVIATAEAEEANYLVGVGGGKAIDIAKMASERLEMGFLSVPTAASHDGIVSNRGSVPDGNTRHSVAAEPPLAVVADTEILAEAPWELTTAGCADIISNYTAVMDWRLAKRLKDVEYSEYAAALSEMTAEILVDNADLIRPGLEESAWIVTKALMSSGVAMSIAGSSRPASGAEHLFSHQLDRLEPGTALHGHQVGVGSIMTAYLHGGERGFWQDIRTALSSIDAPTTAAELGIDDETVLKALTTCHEIRDRYTILGDGMNERAAREVATKTGVIE
ncbi:NAD(P)-dependent glycerol-1-phosphate dehydrogenase [Salinadaptatus halalkaliphilus]|uniref:Glycerol-1-phosphate dehydrogenase [NAD(P)+] n=1 Tax=Salinadaptatus halalkaliphilus TaxID=2419781 RepID=A0A4S3TRB9_9EURY|nr:NAD(P)-dependent glycerol-1-phosphate dehydrogenase [Salinadaptatus halalkaliphilus]THE66200.1 NAD(P)-dependent glycerol-1-phosphate dehydrogenase [Salinadaptatus halalkaliphilus]